MKRAIVVALMVCLLVAPAAAQPSLTLLWSQSCTGRVVVENGVVECWEDSVLPTPTATPEPGATETPTVPPNPTETPTAEPTATPEPGVPMCAHDMLSWHDLYDEVLGCRFDHEHGDNPHVGDAVFGAPGAWYGAPDTEIGGPFAPPHEMTGGHRFWKWYVHSSLPINRTEVAPPGYYVKAARAQMHAATGGNGIKHRYHGVTLEMQLCTIGIAGGPRTSETCGIARYAGVGDYGNLRFTDTPEGLVLLPHEGDGQHEDLGLRGRRNHPTIEQINAGQWPGVTWYQKTWCANDEAQQLACFSSATLIDDPWDYIEPLLDDVAVHRIPNAPDFNGSSREFHVATSAVSGYAFPGDELVSFQWAGNVDGTFNPACSLGQQDCGYVSVEDVPTGYIRYANHAAIVTDYDTSPDGESWLAFPN